MQPSLNLRVRAPAKVNLCLHVGTEPRPDGLHEICSLFQSVSLADELFVAAGTGTGDLVDCPAVAGSNLVATAIAGYRSAASWPDFPLAVRVEKRIPIAAGLGGGSADAAALLRALNASAPQPLAGGELRELAMGIGADVPSQLEPGLHLVRGAGEVVQRLAAGTFGMLLVPGSEGLSTGEVYAAADRIGGGTLDLEAVCAKLTAAVTGKITVDSLARHVHNDLETAAIDLMPTIQSALDAVRALDPLACAVTGSGPTVFAIFRTVADAEMALAASPIAGAVSAAPVDAKAGTPRPSTSETAGGGS